MSATRHGALLAILFTCFALSSCGNSSSGSKGSAQAPIFSTTPPAGAAQGTAYSYQVQAVDPSGGTVTFALTTGPTGATLSGSTVSWTPTAAQSRTGNNFVVTATTSEGGTATQSWSVSPTGVVTLNWVNTYWEPSGPVQVPADASASLSVSAVVPNADGSLTVLKGATVSPGVISIAGVPAGNYWLTSPAAAFPLTLSAAAFWTSASTVDFGRDIAGSPPSAPIAENQTNFAFSLSGLNPVNAVTPLVFDPEQNLDIPLYLDDFSDSTSFSQTMGYTSTTDWSQVTTAFLGQYELTTLGPWNLGIDGASTMLSGLSFTNGITNSITATLSSAPTSLGITVQGSQWASVFSGASVLTPASYLSAFSVAAEPFVTGVNAPTGSSGVIGPISGNSNIVLAATPFLFPDEGFILAQFLGCDPTGFSYSEENTQSGVTTDETMGTLQYSDSLPSSWTRAETFCDEAITPVAVPGTSTTANFALVASETVAPSNSPLAPIVSTVQSPTINNASLFTATTINTGTPSLSWSAPVTGAPYGYAVAAFVFTDATNIVPYAAAGIFYTSQTSVTLPPLSAGNTYVFSITALVDGAANIQTSPFSSALPTGYASVVSAPIAISSSAPEVQIHGDSRVVKRLSQPQPVASRLSRANIGTGRH
jgi:hypothetical protein